MKNITNPQKLKNKLTQEIFYTRPDWMKKSIDGVEFITVSRQDPKLNMNPPTNLIRKDILENTK